MVKANITDGNFKVAIPTKSLEFTGERMTTAIDGQIEFEHFHRYCLARDLCQGLDVLDVASGEGYGSAILANVARSVTGVDIDSGSVAHAREAYRAENLRFLQGNALDLPLDDASIDAVVSFETLEHVREHARFAAEVRRVLRPGGFFIVSTPERMVYSARGEHFNEFHLLELTEPEFESFLRANFAHAMILRQRAILGSVIAAPEGAGPWRSYERRAPEYIEASSGLARAPYLIGVASDADLPQVPSSAYVDRQTVDEATQGPRRALAAEARAAERERERDTARAALAETKAQAAERERDALSRAAIEQSHLDLALKDQLQDFRRISEDQLRELAAFKRADYNGRVHKKLRGLGLLFPGRAKKLRRLAINYRIIAASPLFDATWYLNANPDVAAAKFDPVLHYLLNGAREGRPPGPKFSGAEYLRANPDVLGTGTNPLVHYVRYGRSEGRRTSVPRESISEAPASPGPLHRSLPFGSASYRPLVSVIVPNYNHKTFLVERIDSILNQTYVNTEIILLDDHSTDGSQRVLKDYHSRYPERVRLLLNDENSGNVFLQWKKGLDLARGALIWICESDDYCDKNFLELIVPYFEDLSVNGAFGKIQFAASDGRMQHGLDSYREGAEPGIWEDPVRRPAHRWFCGGFGVNNVIPNVGGSVWRKQALLDQIWAEAQTANVVGDWFLYCQFSGGGQIAYEPRAVSYFRQHNTNTSVLSFKTEKYYLEHQWLLMTLRRFWGVPENIVNAFVEKLYYQYKHFNVEGTLRPFEQLFEKELILQTQRSKLHILIGFLGFHTGGGEVFAIQLANSLKRAGHVVSMFALDMTHTNQGMLDALTPGIAIYSKKDISEVGADRFLADAGVSIIHSHMISVDAFFFDEARITTKIPYLVTLHGSYEACPIDDGALLRIIKGVSHWVYTAEKNLEVFRSIPLDSGMFSKLGNAMPIDSRPFERTRKELGISDDAVVFTLVARGIEKKGWEESIRAFIRLRTENPEQKMHLLLCGEGEVTSQLAQTYADDPDITFLGYQSRINGLYRISDCAIVPTRFAGESFPLCIVQAMQVGTPIIATRIGEIENMICRSEEKAGILIQPYEDDDLFKFELFASMKKMMDKATRMEFSKNSAEFGKLYDMDELANRYYQLYESVIEMRFPVFGVQGH
jgi:glycosyltransferase involved in cell wall biosynthesis/ubiquinone/menaquinone biosynthesis C-methylase UbiE